MKNARGKKLTDHAARVLLGNVPHRIDLELSTRLMCDAYALDDGSALLRYRDGSAVLWYSYDELVLSYKAGLKRELDRNDPLTDVLPDPERFPSEVDALVAKLPQLLRIDVSVLDFSEDSLDVIDSAIRRLGSERLLTGDVFPSFVAYVGEVIRRHVNGVWELSAPREGMLSAPDVVDVTGKRYSVLRIYKQLLEHGRDASMRAFVHAALRTHRLLPRH